MLAESMSDDTISRTAVATYVAYHTRQHLRHKGHTTAEYQIHYMNQMLNEAVRDDASLLRCCGAGTTGRGL